MFRIDVITIFPELFETFRQTSLLGAAREAGTLSIETHDLRSYTEDVHRSVDDEPYGGGPGMVMKPEPLVRAIEELAGEKGPDREARGAFVVLLSPQGRRLDQKEVRSLAGRSHLVLVCGRYEGIDQRAIDLAVDQELSIGDYVLSGGEVPAMALIEATTRLVPGVIGNPESLVVESFEKGMLEGPSYTRPAQFRGQSVPEVLRSGDHGKISRWREERARERTQERRPDLLEQRPPSGEKR
ncbi:MAG: tRNA (guanosine(37)-N1)-methyltransferase TrmD [Myxococcota bacterium]|nr:tRNA (guanosine(37)-N1)-methyltransferase TrmD [Myxococcota bacterium]